MAHVVLKDPKSTPMNMISWCTFLKAVAICFAGTCSL